MPLWQHVMANGRLCDLFVEDRSAKDGTAKVNPELVRLAREQDRFARSAAQRPARGGRRPRGVRGAEPGRRARAAGRRGAAAGDHVHLQPGRLRRGSARSACTPVCGCSPPRSGPTSASFVEARCADIPPEDLHVLGYHEWLEGLERGIAAHHAGMLPTFKEVVEQLFVRGLVKAVFATETLALGINMPARSVVLERLVKWNGESHADVTPGEYTQLTGRAGRRGIDVEGHAVVVWAPGLEPAALGGLASTRTYPLRSSFRPSYNMAVNLVGPGRPGPGPRPAAVVVRPVPGRPGGGRAGPAGGPQRGGARGLPRGDDLPPRRLRGVRRAAPGDRRPGGGAVAQRRGEPAGPGSRLAGGAAARRRHPGARPGVAAAWRWCSTRARRPARTGRGPRCSPPSGRCAGSRWPTSRCRSRPSTGCGSRRPSTRATRPRAATWRPPCAAPAWPTARRAGPGRPGPRPPTTPSW